MHCTSRSPTVMGLLSDSAAAIQTVADVLMLLLKREGAKGLGVLLLPHHVLDRAAASDNTSRNARPNVDIP